MSGGSVHRIAEFSFPAFMIVAGLLALLVPFHSSEQRADGLQLRYGDGGTDLRRSRWERWYGVPFIILGVLGLLRPSTVMHESGFLLALGAGAFAMALYLMFFAPQFHAWRIRRYEARIADRLARGSDAYFEELRELRVYPPYTMTSRRRLLGALILIVFGATWLVLAIAIAR